MADKKDFLICRCEEVARQQILDAIEDGAKTMDEIKRRTRTGMGLCQGRSCGLTIQKILAAKTEQNLDSVMPFTVRPPVRALSLAVLASVEEDGDERS